MSFEFLITQNDYFIIEDTTYEFVRGRTRSGKRVEVIFYGLNPCFFILESDYPELKENFDYNPRVIDTLKWENTDHPVYPSVTKSLYEDPVLLVQTRIPKDVRDSHSGEKRNWKIKSAALCSTILKGKKTFQSDIPFDVNWLIWTGVKSGIRIPSRPDMMMEGYPAYDWKKIAPFDDYETEVKINAIDIETYHMRGDSFDMEDPEKPITAITVQDFSDMIMYQYAFDPEKKLDKKMKEKSFKGAKGTYTRYLYFFPSEKKLLTRFVSDYEKFDADRETAWNSDFDFSYIIKRCKKLSVDPNPLSPFPFKGYKVMARKNKKGKIKPFIKGRTIIDSIEAYKEATKFSGQKHTYSLEAVSNEEIKKGKVKKRTEKGKRLTVGELLRYNFRKFLKYNAIDTELVVLIGKVRSLWSFTEKLRRLVGITADKVFSESILIHTLFVRESMKRGMAFPNRKFGGKHFKGGKVFETTPGLWKDVVAYDFKSLYAYIIWMFNISLETLIKDPTQHTKEYLDTCIRTPNGLYFKSKEEQIGIIPSIIEGLILEGDKAKQDYLKSYNERGRNDPYTKALADIYSAWKAVRNTVYGVLKFYNVLIAAAITSIAREAIITASEYVESIELVNAVSQAFGFFIKVLRLYGDTDSTYNGGIDATNERLMEFIGEWVSDALWSVCEKYNVKENKFIYRAEASYAAWLILEAKKKYSGLKVREYKETVGGGEWKTIEKFEMVGHEKSDISKFGNTAFKEFQKQIVYSAIHDFDLREWISTFMQRCKKLVMSRRIKPFDLAPTKKQSMEIGEYKSIPICARAAEYSNRYLGTNYAVGEKIPHVYVNFVGKRFPQTDIIAIDEEWTHEDLKILGIEVDLKKMFEKQITKKFKPTLDLLGYNVDDLLKGMHQSRLI
jgi:DNA polymerase elongation subunit (family B)